MLDLNLRGSDALHVSRDLASTDLYRLSPLSSDGKNVCDGNVSDPDLAAVKHEVITLVDSPALH